MFRVPHSRIDAAVAAPRSPGCRRPRLAGGRGRRAVVSSCASAPAPAPAPAAPSAPDLVPKVGLRIEGSVDVAPGTWLLPTTGDQPALVLEGLENAVVDLGGALLRGAPAGTDLDRCDGIGVLVRGCRDVVLRNGGLGGWRACVVVEDSTGVVLEDLLRRLVRHAPRSSIAAEDGADGLAPRERRGAVAGALRRGDSLTRCRTRRAAVSRAPWPERPAALPRPGGRVYDNDFSFLSGWGLALWRAGNTVSRNVFDYCVRGYSHGVYWRGQDSGS